MQKGTQVLYHALQTCAEYRGQRRSGHVISPPPELTEFFFSLCHIKKKMSATSPAAEHEYLIYARVKEELDDLAEEGTPFAIMEKDSELSQALQDISCTPFIQFPVSDYWTPENKCNFTISDVSAGTLRHPDIDVILKNSTPSAFGRGEETVLDPSYRSGREIPAEKIGFPDNKMLETFAADVQEGMFPGCNVKVKLYKLAVYEPGGHFDWHMDSTHSDTHNATLLVALNTSWKGGDLVLRRNDIETHIDLQPEPPVGNSKEPILQTVAFYTDTEHRVEPVTEGVRIVLQYDVEIEGMDDNDSYDEDEYTPWMDKFATDYSRRMKYEALTQATSDKAALEKVTTIISKMHESGVEEVAFAMQHLYRKASITPHCLKGPDAVLYNALLASGRFDVSLRPVVLREASSIEGVLEKRFAYQVDDTTISTSSELPPLKKRKLEVSPKFHIPKFSAIIQISAQEYVEYTGNEAMLAEYRYFGGGMFVRAK